MDTNPEPLRSHWDSYEPRAETPAVGSTWVWESNKPHARQNVEVREVKWNGEEWWVKTAGQSGEHWNDLSRFWEACWPDPDPNRLGVGDEITWAPAVLCQDTAERLDTTESRYFTGLVQSRRAPLAARCA